MPHRTTQHNQSQDQISRTIRENIKQKITTVYLLLKSKEKRIIFYIWRLSEIHIHKIVLVTIACLCLTKVLYKKSSQLKKNKYLSS